MLNDVLHALSDPTRRDILRALRGGDKTAGELAARYSLAKSTMSGHFGVLKQAGLVVAERRGTTITYSLNTSVTEETLSALMELLGSGKERSR